MQNRKIKARNQRIMRWTGLILSSAVILWLLTSLITNQGPISVLQNLWGNVSGYTEDPMKMNKKSLRKYVIQQNQIIDSLSTALEECEVKKGKKGIVNVNAPTLNMRNMPSLSSDIVLKIPNGTEVIINFYDTERYYLDGVQGQWCNITHSGNTGWVWGPYIREE